ncbi:hypothetical protein [Bacillus cereus group sp. TH228LC]|uniref:hypothetical protein n=1 Tax=Bacillus cereus group sp. TH228LC TaxID=3018049 RepID=UPI0022E6693F|nr:hypothetical protein [Bacillus cereus group sp. TH228LC]MDA1581984.1 hypothetical protein [Bacillus cereus group sp. TH228LC]
MASCISILDWYQNGDLSVEDFLGKLYDCAISDYHSGFKEDSLYDAGTTNDCIKTAQVGTCMKKRLNDFIKKYIVLESDTPNIMYFPVYLYSLYPEFDTDSITSGIQKEFEDDIYHILLSSIDGSDKDTFIFTCLNWEKTFISVWEERVKKVSVDLEMVMKEFN